MTISDRIRMLCAHAHISVAELARRTGRSPQAFAGKMKLESFTEKDLQKIADAVGYRYVQYFESPDGDRI